MTVIEMQLRVTDTSAIHYPAHLFLLQNLSSPCRWPELNLIVGVHDSAFSEVYYKNCNSLLDNFPGIILEFQSDLIQERGSLHSRALKRKGGVLHMCIGFIYGIKIEIARPSWPNLR